MKRSIVVSLALALAFAPAAGFAQGEPPPGPPPGADQHFTPTAAQMAGMRQVHAQAEALHVQTRTRMITALTPAHRAALATIVGQLTLAPNPDPHAAAASLDAVLAPAEKQTIVAIESTQRANMQTLMRQARAAFAASLPADERAQMAQRESKRESMRANRPLPPEANDPGAIVLRTLANVGGSPGMMHGRPF